MFKKTKTVFVLLLSLVLLLIVVTNTMIAEWECNGRCAGCRLLNCDVHIEDSQCCAYCNHTYLGKVYCCAPDDGCYYLEH